MSRYIDADKLKAGLSIPSASIIEIGKAITAQIDAQPTADVVEIVRCKDCFMHDDCKARVWYGEKGFCSMGERAEA